MSLRSYEINHRRKDSQIQENLRDTVSNRQSRRTSAECGWSVPPKVLEIPRKAKLQSAMQYQEDAFRIFNEVFDSWLGRFQQLTTQDHQKNYIRMRTISPILLPSHFLVFLDLNRPKVCPEGRPFICLVWLPKGEIGQERKWRSDNPQMLSLFSNEYIHWHGAKVMKYSLPPQLEMLRLFTYVNILISIGLLYNTTIMWWRLEMFILYHTKSMWWSCELRVLYGKKSMWWRS